MAKISWEKNKTRQVMEVARRSEFEPWSKFRDKVTGEDDFMMAFEEAVAAELELGFHCVRAVTPRSSEMVVGLVSFREAGRIVRDLDKAKTEHMKRKCVQFRREILPDGLRDAAQWLPVGTPL